MDQPLHKVTELFCHFTVPKIGGSYTFFLSSKKAFTPSYEGSLRLVFRCFRCEGLDFQVFTPSGTFAPWLFLILVDRFFRYFLLSVYRFLRTLTVSQKGWRLFRDVFFCNERVLHSDGRGTVCEIQVLKCECCEGFKIKAFTLETIENQRETRSMWKGEGFFRELRYEYARARETPVFTSL